MKSVARSRKTTRSIGVSRLVGSIGAGVSVVVVRSPVVGPAVVDAAAVVLRERLSE